MTQRISHFPWLNITWSELWLSCKKAKILPRGKSWKTCAFRLKKLLVPISQNSQLKGFSLSNNKEQPIIKSMDLHSLIVSNNIQVRGVDSQICWMKWIKLLPLISKTNISFYQKRMKPRLLRVLSILKDWLCLRTKL